MNRKYILPGLFVLLFLVFAFVAYRTYMQPAHSMMTPSGLQDVSAHKYLKLMEASKDNILGGNLFYEEAKAQAERVTKEALPFAGVSIVCAAVALGLFVRARKATGETPKDTTRG